MSQGYKFDLVTAFNQTALNISAEEFLHRNPNDFYLVSFLLLLAFLYTNYAIYYNILLIWQYSPEISSTTENNEWRWLCNPRGTTKRIQGRFSNYSKGSAFSGRGISYLNSNNWCSHHGESRTFPRDTRVEQAKSRNHEEDKGTQRHRLGYVTPFIY